MKRSKVSGDVIELPHARQRAIERLQGILTDPNVPIEQIWSACRVLESVLHMHPEQARVMERLATEVAEGMCLSVSYSPGQY